MLKQGVNGVLQKRSSISNLLFKKALVDDNVEPEEEFDGNK